MTFGMKTGEVIGWEPAEAGSFFFYVLFLYFYFLSMSIFSYKKLRQLSQLCMRILNQSDGDLTLEASFYKIYIFLYIECLKCSSSVRYWGFNK